MIPIDLGLIIVYSLVQGTTSKEPTMSLGIAFKGPEGIVLAADSRATITGMIEVDQGDGKKQHVFLPASYDNATKLLRVNGQEFVGVVTYGLGAIGESGPRTPNSYIPEFEEELEKEKVGRLHVEDFSKRLAKFFMSRWKETMPKDFTGPGVTFLIAGYDPLEPYGKIYELTVPGKLKPKPWHNTPDGFGPVWGGQIELTSRLIHGYDDSLIAALKENLALDDNGVAELKEKIGPGLRLNIPYQFLALQDCVDLAVALIQITITLQGWLLSIRGVGGAIDVATITKTGGFVPVRMKEVTAKHMVERL